VNHEVCCTRASPTPALLALARGQPSRTPTSTSVIAAAKRSSPLTGASASSKEIKIQPNGIQIGGWKIKTQNSTIGDEIKMEELTVLLEATANDSHDKTTNYSGTDKQCTAKRKRRLCPPEITFLDAIVSFQYRKNCTSNNNTIEENDRDVLTTEVRFTAQDALLEWAEAHMYLELEQKENVAQSPASPHDGESRGVSIIRTVDAKIWSSKRPQDNIDVITSSTLRKSEFYYDWTFSSPYAGTVHCPPINNLNSEEREDNVNNRRKWQHLEQSCIPFHLLTDTTQPILLYDDIHLYEDDLHDNGDVSLNIKIRVMPRCWYVLQRLFVRVDHVCIRCREARYFCLFEHDSVGGDGDINKDVRANTIYRDVVWRETKWEELGRLGLPMDPAAWREDGNAAGMPPLATLLTKLPAVPLPADLPRFAFVDVH